MKLIVMNHLNGDIAIFEALVMRLDDQDSIKEENDLQRVLYQNQIIHGIDLFMRSREDLNNLGLTPDMVARLDEAFKEQRELLDLGSWLETDDFIIVTPEVADVVIAAASLKAVAMYNGISTDICAWLQNLALVELVPSVPRMEERFVFPAALLAHPLHMHVENDLASRLTNAGCTTVLDLLLLSRESILSLPSIREQDISVLENSISLTAGLFFGVRGWPHEGKGAELEPGLLEAAQSLIAYHRSRRVPDDEFN